MWWARDLICVMEVGRCGYMNMTRDLLWGVYSGEVGGEVGTRSRMCHGGWEVWVHEYDTIDLTILT